MYTLIVSLILIALLNACSSKSNDNNDYATPKPDPDVFTKTTKPEIFVCDDVTEHSLSVTGESTEQLGTELTFTNFRYISAEGGDTVLYASTGAAMLDQMRMELAEFPHQSIAAINAKDILLTLDQQGITLTLTTQNQTVLTYHSDCDYMFLKSESTCGSIGIDQTDRTISFTDTPIGSTLTLNGSFTWETIDEYNSGRPACLVPSTMKDMIGIWDATIDYGDGFVDIAYYEFTDDSRFIIYDYLGDTAFQGEPMDCYYADPHTILNTTEDGVFSFFSEQRPVDFYFTIRTFDDNRITTSPFLPTVNLKPINKKPDDFSTCSF